MDQTIIVGILSLLGTLIGTLGGILTANKLTTYRIEQLESNLHSSIKQLLVRENHRLQLMEKVAQSASPQLMLQRGYTITRCDGKVVRDASLLSSGAILTTEFADGTVQSEVLKA